MSYDEQLAAMEGYGERQSAVMPGEQQSPEWLSARVGNCTGSKFGAVMAKRKDKKEAAERYKYRMQLVVERITGQPTENYVSEYMQHGIDNEPAARMKYVAATGALVDEVGFIRHPTIERCGGSVDGLVGDDGIIEIKAPTTFNHLETILADAMPEEHIAQVQGYLWITGRQYCDFISYDPRLPDGLNLFVHRIKRNDDYIAELAGEVLQFLSEVDEMLLRLRSILPRIPV